MDPITMGLLKLGANLMKNAEVENNVRSATEFFLSFDKNGDQELDPDEISAALEVYAFFKLSVILFVINSFCSSPFLLADTEGCKHTRGIEPEGALHVSHSWFEKMARRSRGHRCTHVSKVHSHSSLHQVGN